MTIAEPMQPAAHAATPSALWNLIRSIVWPENFFSPSIRAAHALLPISVIVVVRISLIHLKQRFFMQSIIASLPPDTVNASMAHLANFLKAKLIGEYLRAAVITPVAVMLLALIVMLFLLAGERLAPWGRLLAIVSFASLSRLVGEVFQFVLLSLRGIAAIHSPQDLSPPIGLGLLFRNSGYILRQTVDTVNVFNIWFIVVVIVALRNCDGIKRKHAFIAAGGAFLLAQLFRWGAMFFLSEML